MLNNQTIEKLRSMRLTTFANEYIRQMELPDTRSLDFDTRLGMLVEAEWYSRESNQVKRLIRESNLRLTTACFADIKYNSSRKLDRAYVMRLTNFAWVKEAHNIIVTGCTGTGKTWLACAFGVEACRRGMHVRYYRTTRLLSELSVAAGDGSINKLLAKLKKADILILDDWGLSPIDPQEGRFLFEVIEDRNKEKSMILTAQLPVSMWHELFEDSTVADAILDRMAFNSYRFELQGPTLRRMEAIDGAHALYNAADAFATEPGESNGDVSSPVAIRNTEANAD